MSELTVILKDEDRTYKQKFLCYEAYTISMDDPYIAICVSEAKKSFGSEPEEISVRITLEIQ